MSTLRLAAFPTPTGGGNPAGVILDALGMSADEMLGVAADVGYSETAFLTAKDGDREYTVRYFSPAAEVAFCGHATIASAIALAERDGPGDIVLHAKAGVIPVTVERHGNDLVASLTTVPAESAELDDLDDLLDLLQWRRSDLDPELPAGMGFAGLWHPILWAGTRERLAHLDYDFSALRSLMELRGWGTVSLLFRERPDLIHSRNAFAIGGVVEDPATGAAAGALGGFLRDQGLLPASGRFTVVQGADMGQPCLIDVDASGDAGVRISGSARHIAV
ncbi:PhzF family phenazine biosynthesis protein [Microbacterium sp. G2-8]|uniref:PhzF family phenazine biosynthesis protein n=1 Tax=Microbacterium sp. G2-8 TaxID=2842454 RepID=UPI001C89E80D|nr:PhzF family phenazine biosynthesis isomerase [Microbacterium sp. G2-8]